MGFNVSHCRAIVSRILPTILRQRRVGVGAAEGREKRKVTCGSTTMGSRRAGWRGGPFNGEREKFNLLLPVVCKSRCPRYLLERPSPPRIQPHRGIDYRESNLVIARGRSLTGNSVARLSVSLGMLFNPPIAEYMRARIAYIDVRAYRIYRCRNRVNADERRRVRDSRINGRARAVRARDP